MIIAAAAPRIQAAKAAPPTPPAQPHGSQAVEDLVAFGCTAAVTASVAAVTAALSPVGSGFGHALGVTAFSVAAMVGGGLAGGVAGEGIPSIAEGLAGTSHSQDERLGVAVSGMLTGGLAGLGSGMAAGFAGASPLVTALTAGGLVVGLGVASSLADHFHK